jgi:hypothetical protein
MDPQASHVTLLNFETDEPTETVVELVRSACRVLSPFHLELLEALREPYMGKPGLEIVMLIPGQGSASEKAVLSLREALLQGVGDVITTDVTMPEDGEYRPHLTLTSGLAPDGAATLSAAAKNLSIAFRVDDVSVWRRSDDGAWSLLMRLPLG